ncbi:hypothetical protein HAP48_0042530 [Bradyrhizobium septentrionale]|uniref:Uncharacterized protein n=1 Tax=Bradyrhizobium septentrionale TaxID=1404411 RepID=A0A973W2G1_9BRAD|nr:hypothetical protein [Bradyrhizobium septentrionale]UGY15136.1 hypothetical protein HAP48_0042530 [Bradyrhizobium septentrionale]
MALKKLNLSIKKKEGGGGLRKLDPDAMKKRREAAKALDFVPNEADVLADMPEGLSPEDEHLERMRRLGDAFGDIPAGDASPADEESKELDAKGKGMKADLARQQNANAQQDTADYYICVVFADGASATEFIKRTNYPVPDSSFIDGHLLASALGFELPKPKIRLQKIRPPQRTLARLVTAFPDKGDKA